MLCTNDLVTVRHRTGRRHPERTCRCDAVPWPHRLGGVEDCSGAATCAHGLPTAEHPDYEGRCGECDREAHADVLFDSWRVDGCR